MEEIDTVTAVPFAELSDEVKQKVIEKNWDINVDHVWWDCVYWNQKERLAGLGFKVDRIMFSGFSSQGDGACFTGTVDLDKWLRTTDWEYPERMGVWLGLKELGGFPVDASLTQSGRYCHEYSVSVELEDRSVLDEQAAFGFEVCDFSEEWDEFLYSVCDTLQEEVRDHCREIYKALEEEYDYQTSDEVVAQTLEANDHRFDSETGEIV